MGKNETKTGTLEAIDKLIKKIFFDEQIYIDMYREASRDIYRYSQSHIVTDWKTTMTITRYIPKKKCIIASSMGMHLAYKIPNALQKCCRNSKMSMESSGQTVIEHDLIIYDLNTFYDELVEESWDFYKEEFDMLAHEMLEMLGGDDD